MPQFTLADIDSRVLDRLDGNAALYTQAERYAEINDALRVVNLFAPFCMGSVDVPGFSIAGQQFYPNPPGVIFPLRAYFEGKQLQKLSLRAISMRFRTWTTDQTSTSRPVQEWVPMGLGMFAIHPIDSVGGKTITINGVLEPAPLVVANQSVTIDDEYIDMIEKLVAHVLQIKESTAIFSQASLLYQDFIREIKQKTFLEAMKFPRYYLAIDKPTQQMEMGDAG